MRDLIKRKSKGRKLAAEEPAPRRSAEVIDFVEALKRSLGKGGKAKAAGRRQGSQDSIPKCQSPEAGMKTAGHHVKSADALAVYRTKRDFTKTAEPKGKTGRAGGNRYLIQKHDARRLHYDLRLEMDGVLKSWAVTRGPSIDPSDKRLAVQVEDHPLDYGDFEGTIPAGEYGGGTVMLWDSGTWEPLGDPQRMLRDGRLTFRLRGKKLKGEWHLVRMRGSPREKRANWLLIKSRDDAARPGSRRHGPDAAGPQREDRQDPEADRDGQEGKAVVEQEAGR